MRLLAICGVPASGKSHLARELSERANMPILSKDVVMGSILDFCASNAGNRIAPMRSRAGPLSMALLFRLILTQSSPQCGVILDALVPYATFSPLRHWRMFWERNAIHRRRYMSDQLVVCRVGRTHAAA